VADAHLLGDPDAQRELEALRGRKVNFVGGARDRGWTVDRYCQRLPAEPPGEPVADGSWATAQKLMRGYEFADPSRVRAVYHPDAPLEGREMLLELRFLGLRFDVGVRVGGVHDETRAVGGRAVRVWGWSYRTLQGHLEMGEMEYELWKWLDTGDVEFRIRRFSRPAPIRNPIVRVGFRIFGRRQQVRFARRACERMLHLTQAELGHRAPADAFPRATEELRARTTNEGAEMKTNGKLTAIYLNDHLALLVGGRELAKRVLAQAKDDELRAFLRDVVPELESGEREVVRLLATVGAKPSPLKRWGAWAGEKAGRLKLNGNPTGYSPLTRLVELEGVRFVLEAERALWRALERAHLDGEFSARAEAAEQHLARAEELRLVAADTALAGGERRL
jgi:uncharacterized protein (UPF0548 family)